MSKKRKKLVSVICLILAATMIITLAAGMVFSAI